MKITEKVIRAFSDHLSREERAPATIEKYTHALRMLARFLDGGALTKEGLLAFRERLQTDVLPQTVNGYISAVNAFFIFQNLDGMKLRHLRVQRQPFRSAERELTRREYERLVETARAQGKVRLHHILITLASTGIRIGELPAITVKAVKNGRAVISLKGKNRVILIPGELRGKLLAFIRREGISSGPVFRTRSGQPVNRSNVLHEMKALCGAARVAPEKVFPHNLRHLFAQLFYSAEKNLAHLADVLGHTRIETTRLYIASSERVYQRAMGQLHLVI